MICGESKPEQEVKLARSGNDTAVFPLSVPSIASPDAMLAASRVHRLIGDSGASIISRVMGLILSSVAVASVLEGIKEHFAL